MVTYKFNQPYYELQFSGLDEDAVYVSSFEAEENISSLFEYRIKLISENPAIDFSKILNKPATFILNRGDDDPIKINGIISSFEQYGRTTDYVFYKAILVPRLWRLNLVYQNEIYQNMDIKQLIETVLEDVGLSGQDLKIDLKANYSKMEYIVQYRESDLNFLHRRLEHFGIYYYFLHEEDKDIIVFTDANSKIPSIALKKIGYNQNKDPLSELESVLEILCREKIVTGSVQLKDYNYMFPEKQLMAQSQLDDRYPGLYYDFGDHFENEKDAEHLAKVRNQEILAESKIYYGKSDCRLLTAGHKFTLEKHYREDWNGEYVITKVLHYGNQESLFAFLPHSKKVSSTYENNFEAIPADIEFRTKRKTPKPKISGIMTAKVDAAGDGEYASIDDQGRYKVKIPFDLSDKQNGEASHYIRMAQPYAGGGYGMHFPLHKNAEVLLTFVDGDPDRPVIAASVPNPSNSSPVKGANQTQGVIRTAGNNEIVIEDSGGGEQIHINQACGNEIHMNASGPDIEIKQKCGNQILMKEAEGIHMKDKYGNEIKLDAAAGFIRIASPTHNSFIEIGKSIVWSTQSLMKALVGNDTISKIIGSDSEVLLGNKNEFVGLSKFEKVLGLKFESVTGIDAKVSYSKEYVKNKANNDRKSDGHIKYDSEKFIHFVGGKGDDSEIYIKENLIRIFSKDCGRIVIDSDQILIRSASKIIIKADNDIVLSPDGDIVLNPKGKVKIPKGKLDDKNITSE